MWTGESFLWDVATGEMHRLASGGDGIASVRFLDEDRLLVTVQRENRDQAYLHDGRGGIVAKLLGYRLENRARKIPVFPGARVTGSLVVVTLRDDGVLRAFDRSDGALVFEAAPTEGTLRNVEIAPDARRILAVDDAGSVRVYDLQPGDRVVRESDQRMPGAS
jgi:hypothetical protein